MSRRSPSGDASRPRTVADVRPYMSDMRCDDEAAIRGLRRVEPVRRRTSSGQAPLWIRRAGLLISLVLHGAFFFALVGSPATRVAHGLVVTVQLPPATPIPPPTSRRGPSTRSSRLPDAEEFQKHQSDVASVATRSHSHTAGSPRTASGSSTATSGRNTLHPAKIYAVAPSSRPAQDQVNLAPQPHSFYMVSSLNVFPESSSIRSRHWPAGKRALCCCQSAWTG